MEQFEIDENENFLIDRGNFFERFLLNPIRRTLQSVWSTSRRVVRGLRHFFSANPKLRYVVRALLAVLFGFGLYTTVGFVFSSIKLRNAARFYVELPGHSIVGSQHGTATADSREKCLIRCRKNAACITVVFDTSMELRCQTFEHTPFYYNLKPFPKNGSTIYVKNRELSYSQRQDGWYSYYVTSFASEVHQLEYECEIFSDFFHMAVDTIDSNAIAAAMALYPQLAQSRGPDSRIIFKQTFVVYPVRPVADIFHEVMDVRYVSVGQSMMTDLDPSTVGYGLCQGDPFNRAGHAAFFRELIHNAKQAEYAERDALMDKFRDETYRISGTTDRN